MQERNGLKICSNTKTSCQACVEFLEALAFVIKEKTKECISNSNFLTISADGSEARKTREEKELVFGKVCVKSEAGLVPLTLLLKCRSMIDFGGTDSTSVYKAMKSACLEYIDEDTLASMLVSICTDGASVNFGNKNGALRQFQEFVGWNILLQWCLNHKLELAVQDTLKKDQQFQSVQDMLENMFLLFKNSGKLWWLLLVIGYRLNVIVMRHTRFQHHTQQALEHFLRNYLCLPILAENVTQDDSVKNKLVTSEMKDRMRGYLRRWLSYPFLTSLHFYRLCLRETSHLSLLLQDSRTLIYDVYDGVKNCIQNLEDLKSSDQETELPFQYKEDDDNLRITVSAQNLPPRQVEQLKHMMSSMTKKHRKRAETKLTQVSEEFTVKQVRSGKQTAQSIKTKLLTDLQSCIDERFREITDESSLLVALKVFDTREWVEEDSEETLKADIERLMLVVRRFGKPLSYRELDTGKISKEWPKVKRVVREKYKILRNEQQLTWCRFVIHQGKEFPNVSLVAQLMLTLLQSSSAVERGFSAVRRLLTDQRTSLGQKE